jgi:DNA uptake protein ComE-like DNA-binding protein
VVAYREVHGDFADASALAKVEGIDKAKITDAADALRFK